MKRQFAFIALAALALTGCSTAPASVEDPIITPTPSVEIDVPPSPHRIIIEGEIEQHSLATPPASFKASDLTILREGVDPNSLTEEELVHLWQIQQMINSSIQHNIDARKAAQ